MFFSNPGVSVVQSHELDYVSSSVHDIHHCAANCSVTETDVINMTCPEDHYIDDNDIEGVHTYGRNNSWDDQCPLTETDPECYDVINDYQCDISYCYMDTCIDSYTACKETISPGSIPSNIFLLNYTCLHGKS